MSEKIRFNDTTLRDGALSLWASNLTTEMILPVLERMDRAGYEAIELVGSSFFKKAVRELRDEPWQRIREVAAPLEQTPLRMMASRINTFNYDPPSMFRRCLELVKENGIDELRFLDPWNEVAGMRRRVELALECGLRPIMSITFSVSPRHTDEYFAERVRAAAKMPVYRLCLKDPGGLLTPDRMQTLAPIFLENAGGVPAEFHTHCTTGLGPLSALEAIKAGFRSIDTAIPPLADASSNPSIFNIAANARALGFEPLIDEDALRPVSEHFLAIAERHGFTVGAPLHYDQAQFQHQIPGGMISNLKHQLGLVGLEDKLAEALEETARVRAELGYPIMVTPLSQFVGSQAVINVIVGERYREVTDQTIDYALGRYGEEAVREMDADVRDKILDRKRARELIAQEPSDPSLGEMREKFGGPDISDEDLFLRWVTSPEEVDALRNPGSGGTAFSAEQQLLTLIEELAKRSDCNRIWVRKPGLSVRLENRNAAP